MPKISVEYCVDISEDQWLYLLERIENYGEDALGREIANKLADDAWRPDWCSIQWRQES